MKKREKILIVAASGTLVVFLLLTTLLPMIESVNAANTSKSELETQSTQLETGVKQLKTDLAFYQGKLAEPLQVNIQRYAPGEHSWATKQLLNQLLQGLEASGAELMSLLPFSAKAPSVTLEKPATPPAATNPDGTPVTPTATPPVAGGETPPAPGATAPPSSPPAPTAAAGVENEVLAGDASASNEQALPVAADGFTFTTRGSFAQVTAFLRSLQKNPEAVEIETITLKNESGPVREDGTSGGDASKVTSRISPEKPIVLQVRVRLFLMETT
jgi:hypothetical protein